MMPVRCPMCGGLGRQKKAYTECDAVYRKMLCVKCGYTYYTTEHDATPSDVKYMEEKLLEVQNEKV